MRKEIGRVIDNLLGHDIENDQEDMRGVYSTGIEEIVGAAKTARKGRFKGRRVRRPAGIPPMARQAVPGVTSRKPRLEIMTIKDPLRIYAGPVDPRMAKLDPGTLAILQMLKRDGAVRTASAPIARERAGWPGSRGGFPY